MKKNLEKIIKKESGKIFKNEKILEKINIYPNFLKKSQLN